MDSRDRIGEVIARKYRVISILGTGAMGVVFRAAQLDADGEDVREVALKMILQVQGARNERATKRFVREIRAAARVRGPNIVPVFDFGQTEAGELFYVMDLVRGCTLREILDGEGRLPQARCVEIAKQICDGLHEAHSLPQPVVHRDLKPANIFIERWPEAVWVRVCDFGIAKVIGEDSSGITKTGPSPGTPRYMAPEQCRSTDVDGRTDLYALGVILFETLSGTTPFSGDPLSVMYQHEHQAPPALPNTVEPRLRSLVTRLLEKDRDHRPVSAAMVRDELASVQRDATTMAMDRLTSAATMSHTSTERDPATLIGQTRPGNGVQVRRWLAAGAIVAILGGGLAVWVREPGWLRGLTAPTAPSSRDAGVSDAQPSGSKSAAALPPALSSIAVLEFRNERPDDRSNDWICTALQTTFNTELGKVQNLRVYSREFMEAVRQAGGGTMEMVRGVGASKFVSGSFTVHGGMIRVDARLVDVKTGMQEAAESVEGKLDEFFDLQKKLALNMLDELPVGASEAEKASIAKANPSENPALALDAYRLLLQGEGIDEEEDEDDAEPEAAAPVRKRVSSARFRDFFLGSAHAAEDGSQQASPSALDAARRAVEEYRIALERGDLDEIAAARGKLSKRQRAGLRLYFENAQDLKVQFEDVELRQLAPSLFALSYLRRDRFADRRTGENVNLEVRIESALVLKDDRWVVASKKALASR